MGSKSYTRRCKYCNQWISLRQMPHGQWVAFEGYDTIHDCRKPGAVTKKSTSQPAGKPKPTVDPPGFAEFRLKSKPANSDGFKPAVKKMVNEPDFVDFTLKTRDATPESNIGNPNITTSYSSQARQPASGGGGSIPKPVSPSPPAAPWLDPIPMPAPGQRLEDLPRGEANTVPTSPSSPSRTAESIKTLGGYVAPTPWYQSGKFWFWAVVIILVLCALSRL